MNRRETSTILAALRYWQEAANVGRYVSPSFEMLATDAGHLDPLSLNEIDELCERVKMGLTTHIKPGKIEVLPESLTMRDQFAMWVAPSFVDQGHQRGMSRTTLADYVAQDSYLVADTMLQARKHKS